ncbi:hypothetical protein [Neptuniibacter sp. QD37_11]|uniref:hypothetical protein n=1 Tax=Neptuniibacter sp. QD37_11 TaxID=3398209 RepID=UPI0039F5D71B
MSLRTPHFTVKVSPQDRAAAERVSSELAHCRNSAITGTKDTAHMSYGFKDVFTPPLTAALERNKIPHTKVWKSNTHRRSETVVFDNIGCMRRIKTPEIQI